MNVLWRLLLRTALPICLLLGACHAYCRWARPDGLDCVALLGSSTGLGEGMALASESDLPAVTADCVECVQAGVIDEAIAGRLSVALAAARSAELKRGWTPGQWREFRERYPGLTDHERHCHEVVALARQSLEARRSPHAARVLARLGRELNEALVHTARGKRLPAPAGSDSRKNFRAARPVGGHYPVAAL